jgi:hypothetical protein
MNAMREADGLDEVPRPHTSPVYATRGSASLPGVFGIIDLKLPISALNARLNSNRGQPSPFRTKASIPFHQSAFADGARLLAGKHQVASRRATIRPRGRGEQRFVDDIEAVGTGYGIESLFRTAL